MSASILLSCDRPTFDSGQVIGTCPRRLVLQAETVTEGREKAARAGWTRTSGGGDQCPYHG